MYITQSYKYELDDVVYVSGNLPEDATILETMNILNAKEGYELVRDGENVGNSVWLHDGDVQENYIEVKEQEDEPTPID